MKPLELKQIEVKNTTYNALLIESLAIVIPLMITPISAFLFQLSQSLKLTVRITGIGSAYKIFLFL